MTRKLVRAVRKQKKNTKQENLQITGLLGIPLDGQRVIQVPNRNAFVYVRLRNNTSEVIQAYNNKVAPSYNLPVIVERQGNRYAVVSVDTQRYDNNWNSTSPFLPRHGNTHSFDTDSGGGGDIVWVHSRQMMPMLVMPSGSLGGPNVIMSAYTLKKDNGTWIYVGNTGTQNLTTYNPSSPTGAVMGLVYLNVEDGNPYFIINSGTVFSNTLTGTNEIVPYIPQVATPTTQIPLAAVRLITGTSALSWANIYDVRQWLHTVPTGTGGGVGATTVQDEGAPLGTATTFNFVGPNVDTSISGSVARVFITGSTGGSTNMTGTFIGPGSYVVGTNNNGYLSALPFLSYATAGIFGQLGWLNLATQVSGKEVNAGIIGYEYVGPGGYLDIIGAGASAGNRWVRVYDNLKATHAQMDSFQIPSLISMWPYLNGTGTVVSPINAPESLVITGSHRILGMDGSLNSTQYSVENLASAIVYGDTIGTFLGGVQVTASTTFYSCPFKDTANTTQNEFPWPDAGQLTNLNLRLSASQPASGSLVLTLQIDNVDTAMVVTVPAGSGAGTYSNANTRVVISANQTIKWKIQNNATASSANLTAISLKLNKRATA